jgi:hypothetical protein
MEVMMRIRPDDVPKVRRYAERGRLPFEIIAKASEYVLGALTVSEGPTADAAIVASIAKGLTEAIGRGCIATVHFADSV